MGAETDLYAPVKSWLEGLGYEVKAEVGTADVVALRDGDSAPVIVELKAGFSLALLQQAVARQAISDLEPPEGPPGGGPSPSSPSE